MRNKNKIMKIIKLTFVCAAFALFAVVSACDRDYENSVRQITGGDIDRGRDAIHAYGCATCHTIPGIRGADGLVGPPLEKIAIRVYLAGRITNTPDNMQRWIRFPREVDPETAMPQLEMSEQDGRDITAYLYTLR
ncbi:c-type cytochrome [soil metagenome]